MHHANLIIGADTWGLEKVPLCDRDECLDVVQIISPKISIDDVRILTQRAGVRPVERPYCAFIIQTQQILVEAQNALLKLFEEPNSHTVFYLIIPRADILLPTLRSRLHLFAEETISVEYPEFDAFKKMRYAERLDMIASRLKEEDDAWVQEIVGGFSRYAHASKNASHIQDALLLESNIYTNGAAKKMLLEHVALGLE